MEPGTVRVSYDRVAERYADEFVDELAGKPIERALLGLVAEDVARGGGGRVADLGAGPGQIGAFLRGEKALPSAAAQVMSRLEAIDGGSGQTDGLATALNGEPSVLKTCAELTHRAADDRQDQRARYRGPEWQWFQ